MQFVDTNVLLYSHDRSAGEKREQAVQPIERLWLSHRGYLNLQVLQEFYVGLPGKIPEPAVPESVARILRNLARWRVDPTVGGEHYLRDRPAPADLKPLMRPQSLTYRIYRTQGEVAYSLPYRSSPLMS